MPFKPKYKSFSVKNHFLNSFAEKKAGNKKLINLFLKGMIVLLLSGSIYWKIGYQEDLRALWAAFLEAWRSARPGFVFLVLLLMPVNWMLETLKWRQFLPQRPPFWESQKATLAGVTIALFTPNRIGDYGGRVLLVKAEDNWPTIVATVAGNYCQLLVLISGGVLGLTYFGRRYLSEEWSSLQNLIPLAIVFLLVLWSLPLALQRTSPYLKKLEQYRWMRPLVHNLLALKSVSTTALVKAVFFAALRYGIYSLQYFFILRFYGIGIPVWDALAGVSSIFFIQTSVPLPPVSALLARGQIAMLIWTPFGANAISILAATFSLFIINLIIPAFLGLIYIIKTNAIKSLGYENHAD